MDNATTVTGWEAGPTSRGTLSLLWGCLLTIFACTWTVLHLNVPDLEEDMWWKLLRKIKWMAITILFPEFILSKAVCDIRLALCELHEFDKYLQFDKKTNRFICQHWWVKYPRRAKLLYRLLGLQPPQLADPKPQPNTQSPPSSDPSREEDSLAQSSSASSRNSAAESGQDDGPNVEGYDTNPQGPRPGRSDAPEGVVAKDAELKEEQQQSWTVVHSYYAQMGGLMYQDKFGNYYALTASKLTPRYHWTDPHPLKHLVLAKEDIEDKSKADWLLKAIAILRITWLILSVAVRGTTGLPVTQLEIATIAFAVFAIATYAANLWKPKDVARPTLLQSTSFGYSGVVTFDSTQRFVHRLRSPSKAGEDAKKIPDVRRVPNDVVWMEGDTPLMYVLTAILSLVFGGLHCIAWNFEFPTGAELMTWRVASLISAILPVITLITSLVLTYLSTTFKESRIISTFVANLKPLEQLPEAWWHNVLEEPPWAHWEIDEGSTFVSLSKGSRNWKQPPSSQVVNEAKVSEQWNNCFCIWHAFINFIQTLSTFRDRWREAIPGDYKKAAFLRELWLGRVDWMKETYLQAHELWHDYEDHLGHELATPISPIPISCADLIFRAHDQTLEVVKRMESLAQACTFASTFLTIGSGIIYAAARLVIMVLLFTSLRAVPEGVYHDTSWTRFLPHVS